MKKTWILTPLLLGVAIWGCGAQPQSAVDSAPGAEASNSSNSKVQVVDQELLERPLELNNREAEAKKSAQTYSTSDPELLETDEIRLPAGFAPKTLLEGSQSNGTDTAGGYGPAPGDRSAPARTGGGIGGGGGYEEGAGQVGMGEYGGTYSFGADKGAAPSDPYGGISNDAGYGGYGGGMKESLAEVPASAEVRTRRSRDLATSEPEFMQQTFGNTIPEIGGVTGNSPGDGIGPGEGGDKFQPIEEHNFITVADQPLSTFSIDVDTASYSKIRSYLSQFNQLPPRDAVRVEELVNYFQYDYAQPTDEHPFAANVEVASCPWNPAHRLVRVGIKGKEIDTQARPASNIVFLLDVSGSMNSPNKLPLLKKGMKMLVDQLGENDKVSIVVYAGAAGMVLEPTYGYDKATILAALDRLQAGGSTNGGQGIQLAYKTATENFIPGGTNRVILCTDGDFNVGETSTGGLVEMAAEQAKKNIYLSILGFGIGNHNDSMLEQLSNKANGNYAFIDNDKEAKKVLVEQMSGTLLTIAKDVKIQIEFNPQKVASYRLVGYENRILAAQDFNDDKKDAGEIGAGHTVTAFYEIVLADGHEELAAVEPMVDELKYQTERKPTQAAKSNELMTLKLRYKQPEEDVSTLMSYPVVDEGHQFNQSSGDFQFASAVAMFGLKLRGDRFHTDTNFAEIEELVASNVDGPGSSYRQEFLEMVRKVEAVQK